MNFRSAAYFVLISIVGVLPSEAQELDAARIAGAAEVEIEPGSVSLLPSMDLRRWPDDGFYEARMNLADALSSAHANERGAVMLDLAELYLGQMLIFEASSFVEAAKNNGWMDTDRYMALHDAVRLLESEFIENFDISPLVAEDRPDRALWLALNSITIGDAAQLRTNLGGALAGLSYQNGPVARALLPLIAEAAVGLKETTVSQSALSLIDAVPDLVGNTASHYLRGGHQANMGNMKSALEAYFEASQGWDRYAALARIALADLALEEASAGSLLAARDVLAVGAGSWRGDVFEVATLERKALVNGKLGESATALLAYRRILTRYPDTPNAESALLQAAKHLETLYNRGADGKLELAEWFELHQILLPTYRYLPQFPRFNEMLADRVFDLGGTYLAAEEYRQILGIYDSWAQTLGRQPDIADLGRIRFKLARALERAQDWDGTLAVLEKVDISADEELRNRVNSLRLRALSELGDNEQLLRTFVSEPDAASLRSWSQALFTKENWEDAKAQYTRLLETYPDQFQLRDASYLLIAAHRTNDTDLGRKVVTAFPELTESEGISLIASRFLHEPPPLLPLRDQMTAQRLEDTDELMKILESSGL